MYIDTGSPVRNIPSNLYDLADENNEILTNGDDSKQPYLLCQIVHAYAGLIKRAIPYK